MADMYGSTSEDQKDPPYGSPGLPKPKGEIFQTWGDIPEGTGGIKGAPPPLEETGGIKAPPPDASEPTGTGGIKAPPLQTAAASSEDWWDSSGIKPLEPTSPDGTGGVKAPPTQTATSGAQPTGKDLETRWINFTNELSGYGGPGGAFDPTQGRTGGSSAATAARGNVGSLVEQYNQKFGGNAKAVGEDKIDFGDGRGPVDVIRDAGNGESGFWFDEGGGGGGGTGGGGGGGGPAPGPAPAPTPSPVAPTLPGYEPPPTPDSPGYVVPTAPPVEMGNWQGTTAGQGTDLYNTLLARANQSKVIDPNDPIIRNQADAHAAQLERGKTKYLQDIAERGGANSNLSAEARAASERAGTGAADFESTLMGRELDARRAEIQDALHGAQGLLTSEQQMQLQGELAKMDATQTNYRFGAGLGAQESQFARNLAQQKHQFTAGQGQQESQFARQLAQIESQFGRNLTQTEKQLLQRQFEFSQSQGQQESQFGRTLGQRESEFGRDLGQRAYEFDTNDIFRNSPLYG